MFKSFKSYKSRGLGQVYVLFRVREQERESKGEREEEGGCPGVEANQSVPSKACTLSTAVDQPTRC